MPVPTYAGWEPGKPGIGEARLYAIQSLIRNNLTGLNSALNLNSITLPMITQFGSVTSDMVIIGDIEGGWDEKSGLLRVAVSAGSMRTGTDIQAERNTIGGFYKQTRFTDIYLYFHHAAFNNPDPNVQRIARTVAIELVSDWLVDGVLNKVSNGSIPLTSRVHQAIHPNPLLQEYDSLEMAICTSLAKGHFTAGQGNGSRVYYGVHAIHEASLQ